MTVARIEGGSRQASRLFRVFDSPAERDAQHRAMPSGKDWRGTEKSLSNSGESR